MPPSTTNETRVPEEGWAALRRFLPYLWPAGEKALKARVLLSFALVLASIGITTLVMAPALGAAVNRMTAGLERSYMIAIALVTAYAAARFGGVLLDNMRNAIFERVGQDATRRLAESTFRHLHDLSLRFHLERRTGGLSRVIERGTNGIETVVRFTILNGMPTILEFALLAVVIGWQFDWRYVAVLLVTIWLYVWFTIRASDWRIAIRRAMNESDKDAHTKAV